MATKMQKGGVKKLQMGGIKKLQKGGSVDGPMEARRKIMGEKKPSLKKTLRYVKKNGSGYIPPTESNKPDTSKWAEKYKSPNAKKMQYGGSNMSLGPVTDFTKIPRPASTTTTTPTPAAPPAPTSVKEAREQARIAKINAKAKGYADGTIVPGRNTGRLIDAGVEGARLVNNAMESRRNPGGMQNGGTILKKATMKPKMQNGGVVKKLLNPLTFAPSRTRKVVRRESKNDKNIKLYNKKKPDGLSPNEIKKLKGMTPPPIRNKMQNGGTTPPRPIPGRPGMNNEPVDYSKMGQGVLPKGTVVDSYYSRNKNKMKKTVNKLKRLPLVKGFSRAKNK